MITQGESRLKKQRGHTIDLMGQGSSNRHNVKANKFKKNKAHGNVSQDGYKELKADVCHFCKKEGNYLKDCLKYKVCFEKNGTVSAFVCFESNLVEISNNTWWLDSGATTHVSTMLRGFTMIQNTNPNKKNLIHGKIEGIWTYC